MNIEEKVQLYNNLISEKAELSQELKRANSFFDRDPSNKDNKRAINNGKIFVKFAGTACYLPTGIFTASLTQRKNEIEKRLQEIELELTNL